MDYVCDSCDPKTAFLGSGQLSQSAHSAPPSTPCHATTCPTVHPNTIHNALGAVLCIYKLWGVFGKVWRCLEPEMWFWVHLRLGPSQMGSDHNLAPKHPQTPPNANICFIRYACMLYDVVGCVWCPPWTAHGSEIPTCAFGTEPEICPDEGHLALKVI